jgi:hypothetical protein
LSTGHLSAIRANLRKGWTQLTIISLFTLIALCYQLYLQRRHNEKSITPLGQIVLGDHDGKTFVRIANNGIGPLIIDRITFIKNGILHSNLEDCINLDPKSYMHDTESLESMRQIIQPGSFLAVFETRFDEDESETEMDHVKKQLGGITLEVDCRDIYDNKITIKRDFKWFVRHVNGQLV